MAKGRADHQKAFMDATQKIAVLASIEFLSAIGAQELLNTVRSISLYECVEQSLQSRLNLLMRGLTPERARLRVKSAQGIYDPTLSLQINRGFLDQFPQFDSKKTTLNAGFLSKTDDFAPGLGGYTPLAMTYSLSATASHLSADLGNLVAPVLRYTNDWVQTVALTLKQPLLRNSWTDASRLQIQLHKKDLASSEFAFKGVMMSNVFEVTTAYYDLLFARQHLQITRASSDMATKLLSEIRTIIAVGTATTMDEVRLVSIAESAQAQIFLFTGNLQTAESKLKRLLVEDFR